jgi:hypothetical protein
LAIIANTASFAAAFRDFVNFNKPFLKQGIQRVTRFKEPG